MGVSINHVRQRPSPWKYGFADAINNRPCESPWKDGRQLAYFRGYLAGQRNNRAAQSQNQFSHDTYSAADQTVMPQNYIGY